MQNYRNVQLYFFLAILLGTLILTYLMFEPYVGGLLLGITLAVIFQPVYKLILKGVGKILPAKINKVNSSLSAFVTVILVILIILAPFAAIGAQLTTELRSLYTAISSRENIESISLLAEKLQVQFGALIPNFEENLNTYAKEGLGWLTQNIGGFLSSVGRVMITLLISLLALYYLLKDGSRLARYLVKISPLPDTDDRLILEKLQLTVNSVIRGSLVIAIVQGILTGIGFTLFGVPNATLWGSIAAITALIPSVGTAIVLIPGILYLLLTGDYLPAMGLTIWGVTAVGLIDNLLGPYIMGRGVMLHPFLILLAVLGGVGMFGPIGFLIGPLIVSFLFALLDLYADHVAPRRS